LMMTTTTMTMTTTSSLVAYREDISGTLQRKVAEWRPLGLALGGVGMASILGGFTHVLNLKILVTGTQASWSC
jgi:hypothetical protein